MSYKFTSTNVVPPEVVRSIIDDFRKELGESLMRSTELALTDKQLYQIGVKMNLYTDAICDDSRVCVQEFSLNSGQVFEISDYLTNGQKIRALKAFRKATGEGLVTSKHFIDSFCTDRSPDGRRNIANLSAADRFRRAFGR